MENRALNKSNFRATRVIAVTGGKGGTGKTTFSVNLATALARENMKVLLFDADLGLSNIDVMLGIRPEKTMEDVLEGKCELRDICVTGRQGLRIIPGASGVQKLVSLSTAESASLIQAFSTLAEDHDYMIVDLASGISCQVMDFTHASQDIIVVICSDPSSFSDSYAVIKILHQKYARHSFGVVVNKARSAEDGALTFARFQEASSRFMQVNLQYLGHVPMDEFVRLAAHRHQPVVECFPGAPSVRAFREAGRTVMRWRCNDALTGGIQFFFEKIAGSFSHVADATV